MKIKVFSHALDVNKDISITLEQTKLLENTGLIDAAEQVILMGNGRKHMFTPIVDAHPEYKNLCFTSVCDSAALFEYPALMFMQHMAQTETEPFHICYIHMKGLTRWGNPNVDDWRHWLNWCVIERWQDNIAALQTHDTSGPNWEQEPWPHHSSNFWWANSEYVAKLTPLIHPHKLVTLGATQFKGHGHWRFDHEAWIGSGHPNAFEIARSFPVGGDHYEKPYPRELYRQD